MFKIHVSYHRVVNGSFRLRSEFVRWVKFLVTISCSGGCVRHVMFVAILQKKLTRYLNNCTKTKLFALEKVDTPILS